MVVIENERPVIEVFGQEGMTLHSVLSSLLYCLLLLSHIIC